MAAPCAVLVRHLVVLLPGLGLWLSLAAPARAGDPPTRPEVRDLQLAVAARRLLADDPALAELNLGVSVRAGVAILWGGVLDGAQAVRALERVRAVAGLDAVDSELYLSILPPPPPALTRPVTRPQPATRPADLAEGTPGPAPGALTGRNRPQPRPPAAAPVRLLPPVAERTPPTATLLPPRADEP